MIQEDAFVGVHGRQGEHGRHHAGEEHPGQQADRPESPNHPARERPVAVPAAGVPGKAPTARYSRSTIGFVVPSPSMHAPEEEQPCAREPRVLSEHPCAFLKEAYTAPLWPVSCFFLRVICPRREAGSAR